jgi:hypothetical protein
VIFLFRTASRPALGPTHPPNPWVPGTVYPTVKRPGRKSDHSPLSNAEFKNGGAIHRFSIRLHDLVLSYLSAGTFLSLYLP